MCTGLEKDQSTLGTVSMANEQNVDWVKLVEGCLKSANLHDIPDGSVLGGKEEGEGRERGEQKDGNA